MNILGLTKPFEMMGKVGQFSVLVDLLAGGTICVSHGARPAAKNPDSAHIAVFPLHKFEESRHVGSSEMIRGSEAREQASF